MKSCRWATLDLAHSRCSAKSALPGNNITGLLPCAAPCGPLGSTAGPRPGALRTFIKDQSAPCIPGLRIADPTPAIDPKQDLLSSWEPSELQADCVLFCTIL